MVKYKECPWRVSGGLDCDHFDSRRGAPSCWSSLRVCGGADLGVAQPEGDEQP